jgi:methylthioribose-1-phosphate isomerase
MGLALTASKSRANSVELLIRELEASAKLLQTTRPTAWNLFWAVDKILNLAHSFKGDVENMKTLVVERAKSLAEEDVETNRVMGTFGASLVQDGDVVGTICNAGWLATAGEYGTALGAVKGAHEQGKRVSVISMETRPVLQGARLTAWELKQDGIPVKVIVDSAVGYCLSKGMIDRFIVGADRIIGENGCYVFNKVGTYIAALAARQHGVPFYVAAPQSTFDFKNRLEDVVVEERDSREIVELGGKRIVAEGVKVFNPAFDVTTPDLIDGIITEKGILYPPYSISLAKLKHLSSS